MLCQKEIGGAGGRDSERGSGGPASRARESSRMVIFQPDQKRFQQSAHKQETRARIGAIGLLSMPTAWLIRRGHRPSIKSKRNRRRRRSGFGARLGRPSLARPREQQDGYIPASPEAISTECA